MLLQTMKENYLEYVKINLSKGTYRFYKNHSNYIINYFLENKINDSDEINDVSLKDYVLSERRKNISNSTINKRIMCLKQFFKFNNIENQFVIELKKFKEEKNSFNVLSKYELEKLTNYLNSDVLKYKNKLLIYILIDTGARISEVLNIKISNINFKSRTIFLDITKTHVSRIVPFTEATSVLLKKHLEKTNIKNNRLFDLSVSGAESLFRRIAKKLNLNKFHPHMLRHTLATKLHKNNVSLMIIQKIMGHLNVSTTERYIHVDLDDILNSYNNVMN